MKVLDVKGHKVNLYNGAEDMPMKRYQRFNKFLMLSNEVGSDFADFNRRSIKAVEFLKKEMVKEAIQELENRRQMVYNAFMEYSPSGRALAILVHSIDDVVYNDISADGLQIVIDKLDEIGFTQNETVSNVDAVKKK